MFLNAWSHLVIITKASCVCVCVCVRLLLGFYQHNKLVQQMHKNKWHARYTNTLSDFVYFSESGRTFQITLQWRLVIFIQSKAKVAHFISAATLSDWTSLCNMWMPECSLFMSETSCKWTKTIVSIILSQPWQLLPSYKL